MTSEWLSTWLAEQVRGDLTADPEVLKDPGQFYDEVIEIDLSKLEPHIVGPYTPDLARPISKMAEAVKENNYPDDIGSALIGSCTNSSYEDIERAAHIAGQAIEKGLKTRSEFMVTPGSEQIRATIERDGQLEKLSKIGGQVLANACGPCIGQWKRHGVADGEKNTILTSFNRNFARRRNDGNPGTQAFIASPEIVTAMALAGKLSFNPLKDPIKTADGSDVFLDAPSGRDLPANGFDPGESGYEAPPADDERKTVDVAVNPDSERLQLLQPFPAWEGHDLEQLVVLLKAKGKCTTDHISPAGPWLWYRGHLDNISGNMFIGAVNAFTGEIGKGTNVVSGETGNDFNVIARDYRSRGMGWIAVGDENYGEGSSREHAAMEPRFLGCRAVITKSFARIHETNLKKQGVLPLTFMDARDYDKVRENDRVTIAGLTELEPGSTPEVHLDHEDGSRDSFKVQHTLSEIQIRWFHQGSALNTIAAEIAAE
jgi:aconitate hydratase